MSLTYETPTLDETLTHFYESAIETMQNFFNGENLSWKFFDTLKHGLQMKSEWAEDLVYQADLTDLQVAALKGDRVMLWDLLSDRDYD